MTANRRRSTGKPWANLTRDYRARITLKAKRAMETVLENVQEIGPAYSGDFRDSWVVEAVGPSRSGDGAVPRLIANPKGKDLRNPRAFGYRMFNVDPQALIAMDLEPGLFRRPEFVPVKEPVATGSREKGLQFRGDIDEGGEGKGLITAERDWWLNYATTGFRKDVKAGASVSFGALARAIERAQ